MARNDAEIFKEAKKVQSEKIALQKKSIALTKEEKKQLESLLAKQKELKTEIVELRQEKLDSLKDEESSIKSMGSMYDSLNQMQKEGLAIVSKNLGESVKEDKLSKNQLTSITKIHGINRSLSQLGEDDVEGRKALTNEYNQQMKSLDGRRVGEKDIKQSLISQNSLANNYANMSSKQKDLIQSQHDVLEGIKKTIHGTIETVKTLYGNTQGFIGGLISGFGVVVGKIGEANAELGTSMLQTDGVARKAGVLSLVFGDAVSNAKDLSAALGDTNKATFELQASVGLMSSNMGISGSEAVKLVNAFSMLNGNSTDVALDMSKTSQEFAKQNGIIPAQLMGDLANSTEEFALFGKDGGQNILRAAGYAAKLGVNMSTLSGIADGLLDFESSITKELELGAMLGKNINLNKARELAYSDDIEGAVKETLKQLGGIDAFNRMDYYQKKQTADLLGVSVAELQKMNTKMENAGQLGSIINESFSVAGESINAGLNKYLGTSLKALGGMVTAGAQVGANFSTMGISVGGIAKSMGGAVKGAINWVKQLVLGNALTKAQKSLSDKQIGAGFGGKKAKEMLASKLSDSVKSKTPDITDSTTSISKAKSPKSGVGESLKSLAGGLKAMGNAKVLFGALNLIPTALGMVAMIAAIPGMLALSLMGISAGLGLRGLGKGLAAFGKTVTKALPQIGIGLLVLAGFGAAMIPLGYALGQAAPAISAFGDILKGAFEGIASIVTAVAGGLIGMLGVVTLEKAIAMGVLAYSFLGLATSLFSLGIASLFALPSLMGLAFVTTLLGAGLSILGTALGTIGSAVSTMSESMGTFASGLSSVLEVITLEKVAAIASLALAFMGLSGSLVMLGISGLVAVPVMMGIGFATMLLGVAFNVLGTGMQAVGLGLSTIMASLGGLVSVIGPIGMLSLALLGLSGALMGLGLSMAFLGLAGLPGLIVLGGIAAISGPIIELASFFGLGGTSGGGEETGALEEGSMSEYETNMLSKMDQLIQATTSQRDIYLDKDKVTNIVMDRGERSAVNKFKLNRA